MIINFYPHANSQLTQKLSALAASFSRMKNLWLSVGSYVQRQTINERFEKEQSPDGSTWTPLAPATVKKRLKRHKSGHMKILQDTGELRRSIAYEAGDYYVRIGSNLKYARTHQFGREHIPARPFLGITPAERLHISNMLRSYLQRILGGD